MSDDTHAKVKVIAPDGSVEDRVKVQFDYEQPLGIDPLEHQSGGEWPSDYKLELIYIRVNGETITA